MTYSLIADRRRERVATLVALATWAGSLAGLALGRIVWG